MDTAEKLREMLKINGVYDVGFAKTEDGPEGMPFSMSIIIPLSDAVVDEIGPAPTHTYFHHYRTVNAMIDRLLLMAGMLLQHEGWRYIPVAASQTINVGEGRQHCGRYSHKKAAVLAGLGTIGKSALFIHPVYGPRVRLGTLFTDCPLSEEAKTASCACGDCNLCVAACPAHAITGAEWRPGIPRCELLDADACNSYMRGHFMKIGRGAVCGICMKVCRMRGGVSAAK